MDLGDQFFVAEQAGLSAGIEPSCQNPYYRFSWDQPIAPVSTPQAAAAKVIKVLAVRARPM